MEERLNVLVVEDEGIVSAGIVCCVQELGHTVTGQAFSGTEAIEQARQSKIDIILMDINLPDMTGIEALKEISRIKKIPCIFITGYSDRKLITEANSLNTTYGYLIKPVNQNELAAAIEISIKRSDERKELESSMENAEQALQNRKLVERAKGLLMDNFRMKEGEAMRYIQKRSRDENKKIQIVARDVIEFFEK